MLLPEEISEVTCGRTEKSAEVIVLTGNEPTEKRTKGWRVSQVRKDRT